MSTTLRAATFNAGLAVGVLPHAAERAPHVADALAELEADIVFVQEVWLEQHWEELVRRVRPRFPHVFRPKPAAHRAATCTDAELEPLAACARTHCDGLRDGRLGECVIRQCTSAAMVMSTDCLNCVLRNPLGTMEEILAPCRGATKSGGGEAASSPVRHRAGVVAYGGSFGTGFLSRVPLFDPDVLPFESTLNARSALYARVTLASFGEVHLFGTHLSPGVVHEQREQIDALLAWIDAKAKDEPTLVLGDLNTGPSNGDHISAHLPELYASFAFAGFTNAYANGERAKPTFVWGSSSRGWMIDHVLARNIDARAMADRILDEPLVIDAGGRRVATTYSDHFGVRLTLER